MYTGLILGVGETKADLDEDWTRGELVTIALGAVDLFENTI